jgi:predicted Holliday junction resolvase-like endonuclease
MELILFLVIVLEAIYIAYLERQFKSERKDLMKAVMAKNLTDYTTSTIIEKEEHKPVEEIQSDIMPIEQVDDKLFTEVIKNKYER